MSRNHDSEQTLRRIKFRHRLVGPKGWSKEGNRTILNRYGLYETTIADAYQKHVSILC